MKEKSVTCNNAEVFYRISGKGFPVVLIHGFAEDGSIWDNQVYFLKNDYQLIVPDLPGSGRSSLINGSGVGLELYADCINSILKTEQISQCIMIGHSMGGYITLAFAEKFPSTLVAFGLFHSSSYADDETKIETRLKAIEFIRSNGAAAFLKTSIPGLFHEPGNSNHAAALIEKGKDFSKKALIQYYEAMIARPDRTAILKNSHVPILFIMGQFDKAVPIEHSLEQSHLPSCSYIHILRNSAHMGMLEEGQEANNILANFLQAVSHKSPGRQLF